MANVRRSSGFTLIENLISIVIVGVGLLGLAALQSRAQHTNFDAYNRVQALVLLETMVNRINANRATAPCYAVTTPDGSPYFGGADAGSAGTLNCTGYGDPATQQLAVNDVAEWDAALRGTAEQIGTSSAGGALNARGCISFDATTSTYTVAVAWQGRTDAGIPANNCAANRYEAETQRRVIWTTFKIGTLS